MSFVQASRARKCAFAAFVAAAFSMPYAPVDAGERLNLDGLRSSERYDQFIVKYRDGSGPRTEPESLQIALAKAARAIPLGGGRPDVRRLRRLAIGADVIKVGRELDAVEAELLMRQLAADPAVEYVELDRRNRPDFIPNDASFSQQYGMATGAGGIRATEAWDVVDGDGTVVAVIDTGIDSHDDLDANVLPGYDFISDATTSNDGNGRDSNAHDDYWGCPPEPDPDPPVKEQGSPHGHGNHVAGIVAAVTNNSLGVAGVAHGAKVVPIRVLAQCAGYDSDVADAIVWASGGSVAGVSDNENPAEVINLSLGRGGACGNTFQAAITTAVGNGTTVVVSAGNSNLDVANQAPANCANVVAVAATTDAGAESSFSNHGIGVDIAAPGSEVLSTFLDGTTAPYASLSGTSMAAPHVAGVVALMQAHANAPKSPATIEALLEASARTFPVPPAQALGTGIVDADEAVSLVNCVLVATHSDFDCDGRGDILWRDASDGRNTIWLGGDSTTQLAMASVATGWQVAGVGHFDGNNLADILWRHGTTGQNRIWFDADHLDNWSLVTVANLDWKVAGVGDFDGDGVSDILWWNNGNVDVWPSGDYADRWDAGAANVAWKIEGVGDFDGDGKSDVLWRHGTNGQNVIWNHGLETLAEPLHAVGDLDWRMEAVGDYDGDGESDILWRHATDGRNIVWRSGNYATADNLTRVSDQTWIIEGAVDLDGNGRSDILWRRGSRNVVWPGADGSSAFDLTPVGGAWEIVP